MLFLEYPRIIVSVHTHDVEMFETGTEMSDILLYRPYTALIDDQALLINSFKQRLEHQIQAA